MAQSFKETAHLNTDLKKYRDNYDGIDWGNKGDFMKDNKLKTITLGGDDPSIVLCPGHVTAKEFNQAMKNEGWQGGGDYTEKHLSHEYWMRYKRIDRDYYKRVSKEHKKAEPYTFTLWDH